MGSQGLGHCSVQKALDGPVSSEAAFLSPQAITYFQRLALGWPCGNTWAQMWPVPAVQKEALECFSPRAHYYFSLPSRMNHFAWNLPSEGSTG